MPNLGDYQRDVPFNRGAAQSLVEALLATRTELYRQLPDREQVGRRARQSWQGPDALMFDGLVQICMRDAERFVATIQGAVNQLETLIGQAQWEQQRRMAVRVGVMRWQAARAQFIAAGQQPPPLDLYVPSNPPIQPPTIPPVDCPPTPRNPTVPPGGRTAQTSADPVELDRWVKESQSLDLSLSRKQQQLQVAQGNFRTTSSWGSFDVSPLIASLGRYLRYNATDAEWTWDVAQAFRRADSQGDLDSADDGARQTAPLKVAPAPRNAAKPTITARGRTLESLPESRVTRNASGLIDRVDGRPADRYVRDVATQRAAELRTSSGASRQGLALVALDRRSGKVLEGSPLEIAGSTAALSPGQRIVQRVSGGMPSPGSTPGGAGSGGAPQTWRGLNQPTAHVSEPAIHQGSIPKALERQILRREYPLLQHVNAANTYRKIPGYQNNCTHCAVATAAALKTGTRVAALPTLQPRPLGVVNKGLATFGLKGQSWQPMASYDDVIREMRAAGPGATGLVFIDRPNYPGHVFQVVHDRNGIVFLDGQQARLGVLEKNVTGIYFMEYK